ncbi:MAG: hypothetical protein KF833_00085 [Verrucomicrobiae bacterium]|nr:hypothetical protein [Verrucomicrobiae bacterium]
MKAPSEIAAVLRENLALYETVWRAVSEEGEELRSDTGQVPVRQGRDKKDLLPRLVASLDALASSRAAWQAGGPAARARHPEVGALVRQSQDLLMKIIVMDRENEQMLLRKGMFPARELPSVNRQRPHFVTDLYRRQGAR